MELKSIRLVLFTILTLAVFCAFGQNCILPSSGNCTFNNVGTSTLTVDSPGATVIIEVWGAGGGGEGGTNGGNGGGGYTSSTSIFLNAGTYSVTVGGGGDGGTSGDGTSGENSSITISSTTYLAEGGGA